MVSNTFSRVSHDIFESYIVEHCHMDFNRKIAYFRKFDFVQKLPLVINILSMTSVAIVHVENSLKMPKYDPL